jgi:23S rRNA (guanosine2251-2'-O)-methyltransferase
VTEVVYGRNAVLEALRAGEALQELLVAEGSDARGRLGELLRLAREAGVPVKWAPRAALDREAGGRGSHQGVVARIAGFAYSDLATILAAAIRAGEPALVLALDEIQDVHNLGSLVRTAEAVGAHGVLLPERGAAAVTAAVRNASAGAVAHIPVARLDLATALDELRERGAAVVGLDEDADAAPWEVDLAGPVALVVGGEHGGLRRAVAARCDALVRLPMRGRVGSLNAAVAGSVVLYEALRQRLGTAR